MRTLLESFVFVPSAAMKTSMVHGEAPPRGMRGEPLATGQHRCSKEGEMFHMNARPAHDLLAVALGIALALGGTAVGTAPASADDGQAQADQAAATVDAVAPDNAALVAPTAMGDTSVASVGGTEVALPTTSDGVVMLTATDPTVAAAVAPVSVSLPKESGGRHAKTASDGTVVYPGGSAAGVDAAVQVLADGSVRLATILQSDKNPKRFTYAIGGATPVLQPDGSVDLVQTTTGDGVQVTTTVGRIAPAWATDARGQPMATHYEVIGSGRLVQVVAADKNATYPIVADSTVIIHLTYQVIIFSKAETNKIAYGGAGAAIWLAFIPAAGPALAALSGTLALYAAYYASVGQCMTVTHFGYGTTVSVMGAKC